MVYWESSNLRNLFRSPVNWFGLWSKTYKLKFGHRGGNHPVLDLKTGKVAITSQNHGYAIDEESLENTDLEVTHIALNDKTNEGVRHKKYPCFFSTISPRSKSRSRRCQLSFDEFVEMMEEFKKQK